MCYQKIRRTIISIWNYDRGKMTRERNCLMKDIVSTTIIRYIKGYLVRMICKKKVRNIVQSCVKKYMAKKIFKELYIEAKNVEHVKFINNKEKDYHFTTKNK